MLHATKRPHGVSKALGEVVDVVLPGFEKTTAEIMAVMKDEVGVGMSGRALSSLPRALCCPNRPRVHRLLGV
jgi:hypothetical protein